jgi:hypothetical protein
MSSFETVLLRLICPTAVVFDDLHAVALTAISSPDNKSSFLYPYQAMLHNFIVDTCDTHTLE